MGGNVLNNESLKETHAMVFVDRAMALSWSAKDEVKAKKQLQGGL